MKKLIFTSLLLGIIAFAWAALTPDAILGVWKNGSGKGHIQIYKQGSQYFGKIVWLRDAKDENGKPKTDRKNPDPGQRSQPLIGLVMLKGFKYDDGEYSGGQIYNPSDGKQYSAYMKLENNNTLSVRGYVGIALFGKTDTWTRVK